MLGRTSAQLLGFSLLGVLVTKLIGVPILGVIFYIFPFSTIFLSLAVVSPNLSWIIALPLSKRAILLHSLGLGFFSALIGLASTLVVVLFDGALGGGHVEGWEKAIGKLPSLIREISFVEADLSEIAISIFCLLIYITCLLPHKFHGKVASHQVGPAQNVVKGSVIGAIIGSGTVFLFFIFLAGLLNPFLISAALICSVPAALFRSALVSIGLPKPYQTRWMRRFVFMTVFCVASLFVVGQYRLRDDSPLAHRYEASSFLGVFSGRGSYQTMLERFLIEDLPAQELAKAVRTYGNLIHTNPFFSGDNWLESSNALSFSSLIDKKTDRAAIDVILDLVDPKSVGKSDLDFYLQKVSTLKSGLSRRAVFWVYLNLNYDEVLKLLKSKSPEEVEIGLAYVRFHPEIRFAELIRTKAIDGFPSSVLRDALDTLSLFKPTDTTMRGIASLSHRNYNDSEIFECSSLKPSKSFEPKSCEMNQCLRKRSLSHAFSAVQRSDNFYSAQSREIEDRKNYRKLLRSFKANL